MGRLLSCGFCSYRVPKWVSLNLLSPWGAGLSLVGWSFEEGAKTAPKGFATRSRGERRRLVGFILDFHTNLVIPMLQMLSITFRIKALLFSVANSAPNIADPTDLFELSLTQSPPFQSPSHLVIFRGHPLLGLACALPSAVPCILSFPIPSLLEFADAQTLVYMSPPLRRLSLSSPHPPTGSGVHF